MSNKLPTAEETLNKYHGDYRFMAPEDRQELLDAIESHTAAHTAALRERVNELKAKIASYESAIDGLKKVVDSLYNLKS